MRFRAHTAARWPVISFIRAVVIVGLALVTLVRPASAQTFTLMQDRTQTLSGFSYNLAWETSGVNSCVVSHFQPDGTLVSDWASGTSGSRTVTLVQRGTHYWMLTCDGSFRAGVPHLVMPVIVFSPNSGFTSDPLPEIQWPITGNYTQYYNVAAQWFRFNSAQEIDALLNGLAQAGLGLQVESGVLSPNGCGQGVEGFNASDLIKAASIVRQHGGTIDRVTMDEPYYYGSLYNGPNACHWPKGEVARQAATTIAKVGTVFPEMIVGDAEPILMPWDSNKWISLYPAWAAAYQAASGNPLAFFMADIPPSCPACMAGPLIQGAAAFHAMGIQFGAFYGPNNQNSNAVWMSNAKSLASYFREQGLSPRSRQHRDLEPLPGPPGPGDGRDLAVLARALVSHRVALGSAGADGDFQCGRRLLHDYLELAWRVQLHAAAPQAKRHGRARLGKRPIRIEDRYASYSRNTPLVDRLRQ